MATANIQVTEGTGKYIATNSITEDTVTKQIQRVSINNSSGTELATSSNPLQVSLANTASNATAVKVDGSAVTQPISGSITAAGNVAHDSADSGNPIKVGAKAIAALSGATLVSAADRTDAQSDLDGAILTRNGFALGDRVSGKATATDTTSTSLVAAGGASVFNYITSVQIANTGSTTVLVTLQDGSGGTALAYSIAPAGGGSNIVFESPLKTSANTALYFAAGGSTTTLYVSAQGFKSKI